MTCRTILQSNLHEYTNKYLNSLYHPGTAKSNALSSFQLQIITDNPMIAQTPASPATNKNVTILQLIQLIATIKINVTMITEMQLKRGKGLKRYT